MNISISLDTKKKLNQLMGNLQVETGEKYSYNEAIEHLLKNSVGLNKEMSDTVEEIRDFYNLDTKEEVFKLMIIRFYRFIKDMKEKGYDKFNLIP